MCQKFQWLNNVEKKKKKSVVTYKNKTVIQSPDIKRHKAKVHAKCQSIVEKVFNMYTLSNLPYSRSIVKKLFTHFCGWLNYYVIG